MNPIEGFIEGLKEGGRWRRFPDELVQAFRAEGFPSWKTGEPVNLSAPTVQAHRFMERTPEGFERHTNVAEDNLYVKVYRPRAHPRVFEVMHFQALGDRFDTLPFRKIYVLLGETPNEMLVSTCRDTRTELWHFDWPIEASEVVRRLLAAGPMSWPLVVRPIHLILTPDEAKAMAEATKDSQDATVQSIRKKLEARHG